jgi:mycothiol synthase
MVWPQERLGSPPAFSLPEGYRLRTFRSGDADDHFRLMRAAGFARWDLDQLASAMHTCLPDGFLVIEHVRTRRLVAAAMAQHHSSEIHPCGGELGWVAGDPEHKGKGLGFAVCAAVTKRLLEIGYRTIYLLTDDFRLPAIHVYLKLGYVPSLCAADMEARWRAVCANLGTDFESTHPLRVPFAEPAPG